MGLVVLQTHHSNYIEGCRQTHTTYLIATIHEVILQMNLWEYTALPLLTCLEGTGSGAGFSSNNSNIKSARDLYHSLVSICTAILLHAKFKIN